MDKDNKYASYFDDVAEEPEDNTQELKNNLNKEHKKGDEFNFEKPLPPSKKIQNDNSKQTYSTEDAYNVLNDLINYQEGDIIVEGGEEYEVIGYQDLNFLTQGEESTIENLPLDQQIVQLESQLQANPQDYDIMYKLIYLYRSSSDKEKLKSMREYTVSLYPISDDMWKEWINDELTEIKISHGNSFNKRLEVISLFQKALKDFLCKVKFLF